MTTTSQPQLAEWASELVGLLVLGYISSIHCNDVVSNDSNHGEHSEGVREGEQCVVRYHSACRRTAIKECLVCLLCV
ncbi:hypothetical protein BDZ97DRAFT_1841672 [Flammula alnicola]|nr:hypothetical protein BDZ97DRAFT_1841672 [Flammula alnicola]